MTNREPLAPPVMAELVPAIHAFHFTELQDVDARDKPGHDEEGGATLAW